LFLHLESLVNKLAKMLCAGAAYEVLDLLDRKAFGKVDAGEMRTLAQAGVTSINLAPTDVTGTNQGHDIGYQSAVSFADGSSSIASTICFQTNKQSSIPNTTPNFTMAVGVDKLPQLPGVGQINSIAWWANSRSRDLVEIETHETRDVQ
jgi:hypothetical protein